VSAIDKNILLDEVGELLRIPSISADAEHTQDVRRAAEWVRDFVARAGSAELVDWHGSPLVVGDIPASTGAAAAPTVLVYAHFDVQPPPPLELWTSPPFEPTIDREWLVCRGVADDKGQLYMLLKAATLLAEESALPVNIRVACDGEEEIGKESIVELLAADEQRAMDAAVIFDADMVARDRPAFRIAARGVLFFHLEVRTGERDLHSGFYGGAALNALDALTQILATVTARDGRVPEPLRAGIAAPSEEEIAGWRELPSGTDVLAEQGAKPKDAHAAEEFYTRIWAEPTVDVNGVEGGSPVLEKTVVPIFAQAKVSLRLAPGQEPKAIAAAFEELVREAAPEGAEVKLDLWSWNEPVLVPPDAPAIQLGLDAFEHAMGIRPLLVRAGGSLPIGAMLARKGVPMIITGFALPDSNIHSPNERLPVDYIPLGVRTAQELYRELSKLQTNALNPPASN
jgi:acetylornithine deacetylase/succinyl-diaminopimelate desuccinylase-like protein